MTAEDRSAWVERFRRDPQGSGFFLDFDGTLSEIVGRPDLARAVPGASEVLSRLSERYALVASVSGRPTGELRGLLGARDVVPFGVYGLEDLGVSGVPAGAVRAEAERIAAAVEGSRVEDKGLSVAVHFRGTVDPAEAERRLGPPLEDLAVQSGMTLLRGKMVLEIAPRETPGKGTVVVKQARDRGLRRCLFAGDDIADLDGFDAMRTLRDEGLATLSVAVRSEETPLELIGAADLVVDRPSGLVRFLAEFV